VAFAHQREAEATAKREFRSRKPRRSYGTVRAWRGATMSFARRSVFLCGVAACATTVHAPTPSIHTEPLAGVGSHVAVDGWLDVDLPGQVSRDVRRQTYGNVTLEFTRIIGHSESSYAEIQFAELPLLSSWDADGMLDEIQKKSGCHGQWQRSQTAEFHRADYSMHCAPGEDVNSSRFAMAGREVVLVSGRRAIIAIFIGAEGDDIPQRLAASLHVH
jgi:hypothetical protein